MGEVTIHNRSALVIGATGLVGKSLLAQLATEPAYTSITVLSRKNIPLANPKIKIHIVNFDDLQSFKHLIKGDDLFCTLGSTMVSAGSKEKFEYIDYKLPFLIAQIGKMQGLTRVYLVSSVGADESSLSFYLKTKGKVERAIKDLGLEKVVFMRPSLLLGKRTDRRWQEQLAIRITKPMGFLFFGNLAKYRPVEANKVALAMLSIAKNGLGSGVYDSVMIEKITS